MTHSFIQRGNTIIEVLIAATLISVAILAALSLSSKTQKQSDFSRDLNLATVHNSASLDWLRTMRSQLGWASFVNELDLDTAGNSLIYCLNSLPSDTVGFTALTASSGCTTSQVMTGTAFQRELQFTLSGNPYNQVDVTATTYWEARARSISAETLLTDW